MDEPAHDPYGFEHRIRQYLEAIEAAGFSKTTIHERPYALRRFACWCGDRGVTKPSEVTKPMIERYQRYLANVQKPGTEYFLKISYRLRVISDLRAFFSWLARQNMILSNPASDIVLPRVRKNPKPFLTIGEVEQIACHPDTQTAVGLRNRAIIEVFYSSGIRRSELAKLKISDLDMDEGVLYVNEGKGSKSRFVPIGERACSWVRKYLHTARPHLTVPPDDEFLFLSAKGGPLDPDSLTNNIRQIIHQAGIAKPGGTHLFRHACATHMLNNGADIRFIQAMLGHTNLTTTEIYTHVAIKKLKEIHTVTHPGANLKAGPDSSISEPPEKSA